MKLSVSVTGAEAVREQFVRIAQAPRIALDATAVKIEEYIDTQVAPHNKTHALERSLGKRRIPGGWEISHDSRIAPYARFVHDGTKPHAIFPRNKKALRWAAGGAFHFAGKVNHPGTKPDKWMERAANLAPRIFAAELAARINKEG
jgi:hypothetical protein